MPKPPTRSAPTEPRPALKRLQLQLQGRKFRNKKKNEKKRTREHKSLPNVPIRSHLFFFFFCSSLFPEYPPSRSFQPSQASFYLSKHFFVVDFYSQERGAFLSSFFFLRHLFVCRVDRDRSLKEGSVGSAASEDFKWIIVIKKTPMFIERSRLIGQKDRATWRRTLFTGATQPKRHLTYLFAFAWEKQQLATIAEPWRNRLTRHRALWNKTGKPDRPPRVCQ